MRRRGRGQAASRASISSPTSATRSRSGAVSKIRRNSSRPINGSTFLATGNARSARARTAAPFIVIAYDGERRPLLLLPLALAHKHGVRIASFMGGKHATFNMALWDRDFATRPPPPISPRCCRELARRSAADVLALTQQPLRWRDLSNPFAALAASDLRSTTARC